MIGIEDALISLRPGAERVIRSDPAGFLGSRIEWLDTVQQRPTDGQIAAEITRLQREYDDNEYKRKRAPEYPPINDQLDDLFKQGAFSQGMTARLKAVKDKYPKPAQAR